MRDKVYRGVLTLGVTLLVCLIMAIYIKVSSADIELGSCVLGQVYDSEA